MIGPTMDQIFRNNVAYAKMAFKPARLEQYRKWFASYGTPVEPTPIEQAAIELLGLEEGRVDSLNEAYTRWRNGEANPLFDRLTAAAFAISSGSIQLDDINGLSDAELIKRIFGTEGK